MPRLPIDQIFKIIHFRLKDRWRGYGITNKTFGTLFNVNQITPNEFARLLRGKAPESLRKELESTHGILDPSGPTPKQAISKKFGLDPAVFEAETEDAVNEYLNQIIEAPPPGEDCLIGPEAIGRHRGLSLHKIEQDAVQMLTDTLFQRTVRSKIVSWKYNQPVGASLYAYAVAGTELPARGTGKCYLIRPYPTLTVDYLAGHSNFAPDDAYDAGLRDLAKELGINPEHIDAPDLMHQALEKSKSVLFVLTAELVEAVHRRGPNRLHHLLQAVRRSGPRESGAPPVICFVGSATTGLDTRYGARQIAEVDDWLVSAAEKRGETPEIVAKTRLDFFLKEWRRFCSERGHVVEDATGPRIAWARWFYSQRNQDWIWPSRIRQRAFMASNYHLHCYFDPTAGWNQLAGMPVSNLPIDIRLDLDETIALLLCVQRDTERRALNWIATSIYWLTEAAAKDLQYAFQRNKNLDNFKNIASKAIVASQKGSDGSPIYRASLALKAVAQDRWRATDPQDRRKAHRVIARRLFEEQHEDEFLKAEFPLDANWGRHRLVILCETIRHLMRSVEGIASDGEVAEVPFPNKQQFPKPPDSRSGIGDYARAAVNFCFGTIFWLEINGNKKTESHHQRKLARRHGAYGLAAELIQLMSQDGKIGEPHWALHSEHVPRYLREAALAMLDMGQFALARDVLTKLLARTGEQSDALTRIGYQLDLVVVLAAKDQLTDAECILNDATSCFEQLPRKENLKAHPDDGYGEEEDELGIRLDARRAHLLYLNGHIDEALAVYQRIEKNFGESAITREIAHPYIAALGAKGKLAQARDLAIKKRAICYRNAFHNEELGFRIAEAHAKRKLDSVDEAELLMDMIYEDILMNGCSERTYLAFLLEAGRLLITKGRYVRAYAGYLFLCYERARSLDNFRTARIALGHVIRCLENIPTEVAVPDNEQFATKVRKLAAPPGYLKVRLRGRHDPRYNFDWLEPDRVIDSLESISSIKEHLDALKRNEEQLRASR
jgi:hypothetical protein